MDPPAHCSLTLLTMNSSHYCDRLAQPWLDLHPIYVPPSSHRYWLHRFSPVRRTQQTFLSKNQNDNTHLRIVISSSCLWCWDGCWCISAGKEKPSDGICIYVLVFTLAIGSRLSIVTWLSSALQLITPALLRYCKTKGWRLLCFP